MEIEQKVAKSLEKSLGKNLEDKPSRRERKKEETKQRILEEALQLFQQQGIANTTIEGITEAADIGKGTFYNYFDSKEAVITYYLTNETDLRMQLARPILLEIPDTKSRLVFILEGWVQFVREHRELVRIQMSQSFKDLLAFRKAEHDPIGFDKFLAEIIEWGQEIGDIRKDLAPADLGQYLQLLIFGPGSWYCAVSEEFPLEVKISEALSLFLEGAQTGGGSEIESN